MLFEAALDALDSGQVRVAEKGDTGWQVNQWLKKAVLLSFRLTDSTPMQGPGGTPVWDKVPLKFAGWGENRFRGKRVPRRSGRGGTPVCLYRSRRGIDAQFRQRRGLGRAQYDG